MDEFHFSVTTLAAATMCSSGNIIKVMILLFSHYIMGYKCSLRASVTNGEEQRHLEIKSVMMAIRKSSDGALDRVDLYRVRRVRQSL